MPHIRFHKWDMVETVTAWDANGRALRWEVGQVVAAGNHHGHISYKVVVNGMAQRCGPEDVRQLSERSTMRLAMSKTPVRFY